MLDSLQCRSVMRSTQVVRLERLTIKKFLQVWLGLTRARRRMDLGAVLMDIKVRERWRDGKPAQYENGKRLRTEIWRNLRRKGKVGIGKFSVTFVLSASNISPSESSP